MTIFFALLLGLGAFFRPQGAPPFGMFSTAAQAAPAPYPSPSTVLFGPSGYCDAVAANGQSITTGFPTDGDKLANLVDLGVKWTRTEAPQFFVDNSHVFGAGSYSWGTFDAAQCALARYNITPVVEIDAGPVNYNTSVTFSPAQQATYKTAADFGQWCGVVAAHEKATFGASRFSLPGNEVNTNTALFPGGNAQLASYSEACYSAIKAANPSAFVYGFELNMDGQAGAPAFVQALNALGCKVGTCYDGIAMHLSLRYPIPSTPCYPNAGGDYSMQCVSDIESAADVLHVLISETEYPQPAYVPNESTKALAIVAAMRAFESDATVDGVSYANVDECTLYPTGFFSGGCLIDTNQNRLPAFYSLQALFASR